jgi:hypothetical protein
MNYFKPFHRGDHRERGAIYIIYFVAGIGDPGLLLLITLHCTWWGITPHLWGGQRADELNTRQGCTTT